MKRYFFPACLFVCICCGIAAGVTFLKAQKLSDGSEEYTEFKHNVGDTVQICSEIPENPFEVQGRHTVVILGIKRGWVEYAHAADLQQPVFARFSRKFKDFVRNENNCK